MVDFIGKDRLLKQKYRIREAIRLQNRIDQIKMSLSGPAGMKLSDMPRNQNYFDKTGFLIQEKMDKDKKLEKLITKYRDEDSKIRAVIEKMSAVTQPSKGPLIGVYQDLIRYFYLEDKSWDKILEIFKIDKLEERQIFRWHGKALSIFKACQKG